MKKKNLNRIIIYILIAILCYFVGLVYEELKLPSLIILFFYPTIVRLLGYPI